MGDSGAWVTTENRLCGMVIAGSGSFPWAYMLPIDQIRDDIVAQFGANTAVGLPSEEDLAMLSNGSGLPQFPPLVQQVLPTPPVSNPERTSTIPIVISDYDRMMKNSQEARRAPRLTIEIDDYDEVVRTDTF